MILRNIGQMNIELKICLMGMVFKIYLEYQYM